MTHAPSKASLTSRIRAAEERLRQAGVVSSQADAVTLAAHVLGCDRSELSKRMVLGGCDEGLGDLFDELVDQRTARVPVQHLTGRAPFRELELRVGPGVFVSRPETEVVAGMAIAQAQELVRGGAETVRVVDLCSGSGAIALALKHEVPQAQVSAVEIDEFAIAWAERNRRHTGLDVRLIQADATAQIEGLSTWVGLVDVLVSNPPYIPDGARPVDPEVREHDPEIALYGGGDDGMRIPRQIAVQAAHLLRPGGFFVIEHADTQADAVRSILTRDARWDAVLSHRDLAGRPRMVSAVRQAQPLTE